MDGAKLAEEIVAAVRTVYPWDGNPRQRVQLHKPFMEPHDWHRISYAEPVGYDAIEELERLVARYCGVRHAIAVSSGTAALHLALLAVGVQPGDVVNVPPLTFVAAAAAVRYCEAEPSFTMPGADNGIAAISVHLLGRPDGYTMFTQHAGVPIIEDAAEALGSSIHGKKCGSLGAIGILSFNNNKIVTTGGGGMVLTDVDSYAETVRHLATTAKKPNNRFFEHDAVGFNYRMPNLCAALGVGQMLRLPEIIERKHATFLRYQHAFAGIDEVVFNDEPPSGDWNYWLNSVSVPAVHRDEIMTALWGNGYECRALFTPLPYLLPYEGCNANQEMLDVAEDRFAHTILLPSGNLA